jgi:ATP-dependent Clp protease ATP-binding subunit ClpC
MTSNVGARHMTDRKSVGFSQHIPREEEGKRMREEALGELRRLFKPEFLNRVDEIIVFNKLEKEEMRAVAKKMFGSLILKAGDMGISLDVTDAAVEKIAEEGAGSAFGARPLRRAISQKIEDKIADQILKGRVRPGDAVICDYEDEFVFKVAVRK